MENEDYRKILNDFHETANEIKKEFAGVLQQITRLNTILESPSGGLISEMKEIKLLAQRDIGRVDTKIEKLEREFKEEIGKRDKEIEKLKSGQDKIKQRIWTAAGAFAVLVVLGKFLLPKLLG